MKPKPKHLGTEYANQFKDQSVAEAYRFRPEHPREAFGILAELISDTPRRVLDAGCGPGSIARYLIPYVEQIDAVDFSASMIERGKRLPNGDHPGLRWICSPVERASLTPPYALITAGDSLHWFDWETVFPRFRSLLTGNGHLAIVTRRFTPPPWQDALHGTIARYSTNRDFEAYDLLEELGSRGLFIKLGQKRTTPVVFEQAISDYIEAIHSQNGFSRERMGPDQAKAFDEEVRALVETTGMGERFETQFVSEVTWGIPSVPVDDTGT